MRTKSNQSFSAFKIIFGIVLPICVLGLLAACVAGPRVTPPVIAPAAAPVVAPQVATQEEALDFGQFALRELPPEVKLDALKGKRIVIDPGHGGVFSGAAGANNLREADVNLGVGLYLWGMLTRAGAEAYLTRMDDSNVYQGADFDLKKDLQARDDFARTHNADIFISLHHNADVLLNAKKNSLETYFKMSDPGPSLDLARCINRQLALSLKQADNAILPGNFHVLRESPATAILGEPSYISNADNAFRLGLAPMQRIEAQAYFLGIAEYFSKGVPKIEDVQPSGTIQDGRPLLVARVIADRGVPVDPATVTMEIDGESVQPEFNHAAAQISYLPPQRLSNGKHFIRISLRNVNGNAATPAEGQVAVTMPPSYILLKSNFDAVSPGNTKPIRLSAMVFDSDLLPVCDGTQVEFKVQGGNVTPEVSQTDDGEAVAYLVPEKAESGLVGVSASAGGLSHSLKLPVSESAPEFVAFNVVDAKSNSPIGQALASVDDRALGYSDHAGYFAAQLAEIKDSSIIFSRQGYIPQKAAHSASKGSQLVKLEPIAGEVLFGQRFALDPEFGGSEKGAIGPTGVRASDLNLLVADYLAQFLRASGASAALTRESDETVSALQRVECAEKFGANWFISISHGDRTNGQDTEVEGAETEVVNNKVSVLHYANSKDGKRLATSIAESLRNGGIADSADAEPGSAFVLTQTSSPAVIVRGPNPSAAENEDKQRHPSEARKVAYAIYCGILDSLGVSKESTGQISVKLLDENGNAVPGAMLTLDGAFALETDSQGAFTFSRVTPGDHSIEVYADGRRIWAGTARLASGRTVSLQVLLSGVALVLPNTK